MERLKISKVCALGIAIMLMVNLFYGINPAQAEEENGFVYTVSETEGTATIIGYNGPGGEITIPSEVGLDRIPVTSVSDYAMEGCLQVTTIDIRQGIESIGDGAFNQNPNLTNVHLPEGLKSIGSGTFSECTALVSISIPKSVTNIGWQPFQRCSSMKSIIVSPDNLFYSSIDGILFNKAGNELIECPGGLALSEIPQGTTSIAQWAFCSCDNIATMDIPEEVNIMGDGAFYGCKGLTSIKIPEGISVIGDSTFTGCTALEDVTIPEGVTCIAKNAFVGCSRLKHITLPNSLTTIESDAFLTSGLETIIIPHNVQYIGNSAFSACNSLISANFSGSAPTLGTNLLGSQYVFNNCSSQFAIHYFKGATGFTTPTWNGYPAYDDYTTSTPISVEQRRLNVINNAQDIYQDIVDNYGSVENYCVVVSNNKYYSMKTLNEATTYELLRNYVIDYSSIGLELAVAFATSSSYLDITQSAMEANLGIVMDEMTQEFSSMTLSDFVYSQAIAGGNQQDINGLMQLGFEIHDDYNGKIPNVETAVEFIMAYKSIEMGNASLNMGKNFYYDRLNASPWDTSFDIVMTTLKSKLISVGIEITGSTIADPYLGKKIISDYLDGLVSSYQEMDNKYVTTWMQNVSRITSETTSLIKGDPQGGVMWDVPNIDGTVRYHEIACPVSVDIIDQDNNVVATISDSETDRQYYDFAYMYCKEREGEIVKVIYLFDESYSLRINGTGNGTMNYTISEIGQGGRIYASRKFIDVQITPLTVIKVLEDDNNEMTLSIDNNGDGHEDTTWVSEGPNVDGHEAETTAYNIEIGALNGGIITTDPASAVSGATISLTVTPDPDMQMKPGSLKYNDGTNDVQIDESTKTFIMPATDVTVTAEFEPIIHSISVVTTTDGIITADPIEAMAGANIKLTIAPESGMQLKSGSLKYSDGTNDVPIDETTCEFSMPAANVTITGEFEPILYAVSIANLSGGSITADSTSAVSGTTINLTIKPDPGMGLKANSLIYNDGTSDTSISGTSFIMPAASVSVSAAFEPIPPGPDLKLAVSDVSNQYGSGDKFDISAQVSNIGEMASPETKLVLYMGNTEICSAKVKNLKPGKSANLKLKGKIPDDMLPGTYDIRAEIVPVANEKDMANNIWSSQFAVAGLDLSIERVDPPAVIIAGIKTSVTVSVDNADNSPLNNVKVNLYYSVDGTSKDLLLGTNTINELKHGTGKARIEFKPSADLNLAKRFMIAEVDPDNTIAEENETNNLKSIGPFVGWDKLPWFWLGPWAN